MTIDGLPEGWKAHEVTLSGSADGHEHVRGYGARRLYPNGERKELAAPTEPELVTAANDTDRHWQQAERSRLYSKSYAAGLSEAETASLKELDLVFS